MKVFVTGKLSDKALDALQNFAQVDAYESDDPMPREQVEARLAGKDALVCILGDKVDSALFQKRPQLKLVANVAVGYDNINIADANDAGVLITNTPGVLDNATADLAFGLLLSAARRIVEADGFVRRGEWKGWKRELMLGAELHGKTLGIVGMGRIGKAVAKRARAFGLNIIYSCQDYEFDQREGLFSIPSRLGIAGALWVARILHLAMLVSIAVLIQSFALGWLAWCGAGAIAALLSYEHSIVKADDLSRVDAAFFTVNGYVSVLFFLFWATDIFLLRRPA